MKEQFETERLVLRPTSEEDAPFILELLNTPKWLQFVGDRNVHSVEDAREYIRNKMLPQLARLGYSNNTVIRKSDGAKMGACGLYDREGIEGVDIGFAFLPQFERQGYAFEAAWKIKELAFEEYGLLLINAITVQENTASQRLLEKLGLKFQRLVQIPGDEVELMLYQLRKEDV